MQWCKLMSAKEKKGYGLLFIEVSSRNKKGNLNRWTLIIMWISRFTYCILQSNFSLTFSVHWFWYLHIFLQLVAVNSNRKITVVEFVFSFTWQKKSWFNNFKYDFCHWACFINHDLFKKLIKSFVGLRGFSSNLKRNFKNILWYSK